MQVDDRHALTRIYHNCKIDIARLEDGKRGRDLRAFERDVARLLVCNGFEDVRLIGGSGDAGADVLGVKNSELW